MWGAGCIMAEMWTRSPIMQGNTEQQQIIFISQLCGSFTPEVIFCWLMLFNTQRTVILSAKLSISSKSNFDFFVVRIAHYVFELKKPNLSLAFFFIQKSRLNNIFDSNGRWVWMWISNKLTAFRPKITFRCIKLTTLFKFSNKYLLFLLKGLARCSKSRIVQQNGIANGP